MINITFPDKSVKQFEAGVTPLQIAESISPRLAQDVLAASVNEQEWDLTRPINEDAEIKLFKWEDHEGKHAFWHSSAHLLAEALQELYPGVKFGIGPAVENGFYYDIDPGDNQLSDTQLSLELAPVPVQFPLLNCLACSGLSDTGHAEEGRLCTCICWPFLPSKTTGS